MLRPKHQYLDLYRVNVYYCIGWKPKEFDTFIEKRFGHDKSVNNGDGYTMLAECDHGAMVFIWTRKKRDYPTLAHEASHAASFILDRAGIKPSFKNDEPLAYLVGWIVEKALS